MNWSTAKVKGAEAELIESTFPGSVLTLEGKSVFALIFSPVEERRVLGVRAVWDRNGTLQTLAFSVDSAVNIAMA